MLSSALTRTLSSVISIESLVTQTSAVFASMSFSAARIASRIASACSPRSASSMLA